MLSLFQRNSNRQFTMLARRWLNLHEYQAKELMDKYGVATQTGHTASTPADARIHSQKMLQQGIDTVVLKAQVFAGGRGKGKLSSGMNGGIQFSKDPEEIERLASRMIGFHLFTHQTPPEGLMVTKLLLTEAVSIAREFYLAIILDRSKGGPVVVASREGGIEIEEVAEKHPEAITVEAVDILKGLSADNLDAICQTLLPDEKSSLPEALYHKLDPTGSRKDAYCNLQKQLRDLITRLYTLFEKSDASQIEINPLAITDDGRSE